MDLFSLIILIVLIVLIIIIGITIYIVVYNINRVKKSTAAMLAKYGEMIIPNCAITSNDSTCTDLLNIQDKSNEIQKMVKDNNYQDIYLYSIQLIATFLEYLAVKKKDLPHHFLTKIPGCTNPQFITSSIDEKPIAFTFLNKKNNTIYFIFRGTQTINDMTTDLAYNYYNTKNPDYNNESIHIHKSYLSLYNGIKDELKSFIKDTTNIFICGHSMGAGLGYILAEDISSNPKYNVKVIGIAPPRIGNTSFVSKLYNQSSYLMSVINLADVIPSMFWSYMPNNEAPNTPPQFTLGLPGYLFYNLAPSVASCHQPITYYNGVKYNSGVLLPYTMS